MIEKEEDIIDENIKRKKDKTLSKHFNILLNEKKIRIVSFLIKEKKHLEREGRIIRLISKFNINILERENVIIKINHNNKSIVILGDWCVAYWGMGQFNVEYWINEINEN